MMYNASIEWKDIGGQSVKNLSSSKMQPLDTTYVQLVIYPILLIICTAGNIINILVLSHLKKVRVKEVLLIGLALSDSLIMWLALPRYLDHHAVLFGLHDEHPAFLLNGFGIFTWMQYTFYYVSDWILITFSCERLAAFRFPTYHRFIQTRVQYCVIVLFAVTLISSIICLEHLIWYYHWLLHHDSITATYHRPNWLANWDITQKRADIILPTLTAISLLVINGWLLNYLKKRLTFSASFRRSTIGSRTSARSDIDEDESIHRLSSSSINMNVLLLGCVALYFFTQFPTVVYGIVDYCSVDAYGKTRKILEHAQPVVSTLSLMNYSANFLIYAGLNKKYRQLSIRLLCGKMLHRRRSLVRLTSNRSSGQPDIPLVRLKSLQNAASDGHAAHYESWNSSVRTRLSTISSTTSRGSKRSLTFYSLI